VTDNDRNILEKSAKRIAEQLQRSVNAESNNAAVTPSMPYRAQWILERVIEILKEAV